MGIKDFFGKIGNGLKAGFNWVKDKALPTVGKIAQPALNIMSMMPGTLGTIGKVGSSLFGTAKELTDDVPNKTIGDKINTAIDGAKKAVEIGRESMANPEKKVDVGKIVGATADAISAAAGGGGGGGSAPPPAKPM